MIDVYLMLKVVGLILGLAACAFLSWIERRHYRQTVRHIYSLRDSLKNNEDKD